jgi:deoxyhypusine synthase
MSDTSRQKLREIVATYGSAIVDDPRRLKALLKDLCGEAKLEISLLTLAAEQRIPSLLALSEVWDTQDYNIHSLCDRLQSAQQMSTRLAIWTVRSWMYALGLGDAASDESLPSSSNATIATTNPTSTD